MTNMEKEELKIKYIYLDIFKKKTHFQLQNKVVFWYFFAITDTHCDHKKKKNHYKINSISHDYKSVLVFF